MINNREVIRGLYKNAVLISGLLLLNLLSGIEKLKGNFFERLDFVDNKKRSLKSVNLDGYVDAIKRNLRLLLNCRQGCSLSSPEMGLVDFNDASLSSPDLAKRVGESIKVCILKHEQRIKHVEVDYAPLQDEPTSLNFRIIGSIPVKNRLEKVELDIMLNSRTRQYSVP